MSSKNPDCFTAASHALAYAEEFFTRFKDGSYNTHDGYAIQKIGRPDDDNPSNYIPTSTAPVDIMLRIEHAATKAALPEGQATQSLAQEFMTRAHETLCRAWVLADERARRHDFSAEGIVNTLNSNLSDIRTAIQAFEDRRSGCAPS